MRSNPLLKLVALLTLISVSSSPAVEALLVQDSYTINVVGRPARSYPKAASVLVTPHASGIFQFSLETLPPGVTASQILKANLKLFVSAVRAEGDITASAPGVGVQTVRNFDATDAKTFIAFPITEIVKAWVGGTTNNGLQLTTETASLVFDSKENGATSHAAVLEIELDKTATFVLFDGPDSGKIDGARVALPSDLMLNGTTSGSFSGNGSALTSLGGANITAGTIPIDALAARPTGVNVGKGGVATAAANAPITDMNFADVAGLTVTLQTTGRPVLIALTNGTLTATNPSDEGGGQRTLGANLAIIRNSSATIVDTEFFTRNFNNVNGQARWPVGSVWSIDTPSAGTTTYKVQARLSGACNASLNGVKIVVFEL